ncbi:hypothetical protein [Streptomyces ossamyceticus]|uniref:Lipoprotein n=1 Tax=Streptomyces ossamyceticus TaxID=249581 RepID=A0ABV2V219_9ACTN
MAAIAVTAALTGCGGGGDTSEATGGQAKPSARAVEKTVSDELSAATVRSDFRAAASKAAGLERFQFLDTRKSGPPCRVWGLLRIEGLLERKAAEPVLSELKERGWRETGELPDEERAFGWALEKNRWDLFLVVSEAPQNAGIFFDASGKACGVPLPSRPAASDIAPPEPPTLPTLR